MTARKATGRTSRHAAARPTRPLPGLGELEAAIMDVVWRTDDAVRVRDVLDELEPVRKPAYTTVMTVMDNLYRKGWLSRELDGRAYSYQATRDRIQAATDALRDLLADSGDPAAALLHFARSATTAESRALTRGLKERGRRR
ncbi:BlaI/MecI/CopY family transcriptional regulator [Mycolicibacterium rhodesiae]|uniref:Penicillinase repressor n=1 Tax=Mycolicibacterium rhodesiae TaxID=36814 RepID=A0A1X0IV59_MYCRH|nr:BlaI/MecI/CopY family transcriptional regulator [Mycolicibacterium rhodesiae]MCV7346006.1 BlaI/MecI/CopY family transcriptional regulator [Mycolicibacterium rhodesiae]ORB52305.1 penicillinase repressor [Mycolicibacterium rhodesiae]